MAKKKFAGPEAFFVSLVSLYFTEKVTPISGRKAAETLPPNEALVLGMMCLLGTYTGAGFVGTLHRHYGVMDVHECSSLAEIGISSLVGRGYLRFGSKAAENAFAESGILGTIPFVVTAKGAARISYLVGNLTGENVKEVAKRIQIESKDAAKAWKANLDG